MTMRLTKERWRWPMISLTKLRQHALAMLHHQCARWEILRVDQVCLRLGIHFGSHQIYWLIDASRNDALVVINSVEECWQNVFAMPLISKFIYGVLSACSRKTLSSGHLPQPGWKSDNSISHFESLSVSHFERRNSLPFPLQIKTNGVHSLTTVAPPQSWSWDLVKRMTGLTLLTLSSSWDFFCGPEAVFATDLFDILQLLTNYRMLRQRDQLGSSPPAWSWMDVVVSLERMKDQFVNETRPFTQRPQEP